MIKIERLSFCYGKNEVLKDFCLEIPAGQACLITGVNGVGKSTLLKLMAGVLRPAAGTISYSNRLSPDPRRKIGYLSDALSLYESLTVHRAVDLHRRVLGLGVIDESLLRLVKIEGFQKVKELSAGQRAILHLSLALSAEPEVLLIDEVLHTIDAYLRKVFLRRINDLISGRTITVVLVNLNFHDIEHLVDRVILLRSGAILVDEPISDLKARVKKIVATSPPSLPVVSRTDFEGYSEYFVYPFSPQVGESARGDVVDLDLTEIVAAFIGGEYVAERII